MIIIATTPSRENWLADCVRSINRPVIILSDFNYELGKLIWCANNLDEPFLFLQDSIELKSTDWIDDILSLNKSVALTDDPSPYGMYMGVYDPSILKLTSLPQPKSKAEAIKFEVEWTREYAQLTNPVIYFPELRDSNAKRTIDRYGKTCLVLENDYLIKYKSNWGQKPALD